MSNFTILNFVGLFLFLFLSLAVLLLWQKIRQICLYKEECRRQINDYYQWELMDVRKNIVISILFLMSLYSSKKNSLVEEAIAMIEDGKVEVLKFAFSVDGDLSADFFNIVNNFSLTVVPDCPVKCEINYAITHLQKTKNPIRLRAETDIRFFLEEINVIIKKSDKIFRGLRAQINKIKYNG